MCAEPIRVLPGEPAKRRGTCLIGCIGSVILVCVLLFAGVLAVIYGLGRLKDSFTSDQPVALPAVEFTPQQAAEVQQRVDAFKQAVEGRGTAAVIELTAQDINVLLKSAPDAAMYADSIFVDIQDDALRAQVSLPLDFFPPMKGRYLNGSAKVDLDVLNDQFVLTVQEFGVHGVQFPVQVLAEIEGEFNSEINKSPEARQIAQKIESIAVENGRVRVTLKGAR